DAIRTDDEVAVAEVAVHERRPRRVGPRVLGEPAQTELEGGVRLAEAVEVPAVQGDLIARALHRERRQARRVKGVNARRLLAALASEHRAGRRVGVVAQDAAGNRLALYSFHHEPRTQPVVRLEEEPD